MNVCVIVFFSLEMWDPLRPKYPQKYKSPNIWQKTKQKNKHWKRQGQIKHVLLKFQGHTYLSKTAWTSDPEGVWGGKVEPACIQIHKSHEKSKTAARRFGWGGRPNE